MYFKTYLELVQYFEQLPTSIPAIKGVLVGSDEDVIEMQNSAILYPYMRVDTPEILFGNDDESPYTRYSFRVYVFTGEPLKTNAAENQALSDMAAICQRIIKQLYTDADAGKFDLITGDKNGDVVRRWSADNAFGWWFTATIDLYTDECD